MIELFLSAFVSLLVIVDPIGTAAVFSGLTRKQTRNVQKLIALRATIIATGVLLTFGLFGKELLFCQYTGSLCPLKPSQVSAPLWNHAS